MAVAEPLTMAELIADCALLPAALQRPEWTSPERYTEPRQAPPWTVDDTCARRFADLPDYGC